MNLLDLAPAAYLIVGTPVAGAVVGVIIDAALNVRDLNRTGHASACLAPSGWSCSC